MPRMWSLECDKEGTGWKKRTESGQRPAESSTMYGKEDISRIGANREENRKIERNREGRLVKTGKFHG